MSIRATMLILLAACAACRPDLDPQASSSAAIQPDSPLNVSYHGGSIMRDARVHIIYWQPPGTTFTGSADEDRTYFAVIENLFQGIHATALYQVLRQYTDRQGGMPASVELADKTFYTQPYPHAGTSIDALGEADFQAAIQGAWQPGWSTGASDIYFVLTTVGIQVCDQDGDCTFGQPGHIVDGWHGYTSKNAIYAVIPNAYSVINGKCHDPTADFALCDAIASVCSHELFEAISNPFHTAWYGGDNGSEIGDKCVANYGGNGTLTFLPNVGHADLLESPVVGYRLQAEWSNTASACVLSEPAVLALSPAVGPAAGGNPVQINGDGFAPGNTTITFGGAPATSVVCVSSKSCFATAPANPRPVNGAVPVVVDANGFFSAPIQAAQYTYDPPPPTCTSTLTCEDGLAIRCTDPVDFYEATAYDISLMPGGPSTSFNGISSPNGGFSIVACPPAADISDAQSSCAWFSTKLSCSIHRGRCAKGEVWCGPEDGCQVICS
jgi:hypothetical protein